MIQRRRGTVVKQCLICGVAVAMVPKRSNVKRPTCSSACRQQLPLVGNTYADGRTRQPGSYRQKRPEYKTWERMRARCRNPRNASYEYYGARGISVCESWDRSFDSFLADVGPRPSPQYSLDRIDNAGNYEPGNVHWATSTEQNRNVRTNRLVVINGVSRTVAEWAELSGLPYRVVHQRIFTHGWTPEAAIGTPVRTKAPSRSDIDGAVRQQRL